MCTGMFASEREQAWCVGGEAGAVEEGENREWWLLQGDRGAEDGGGLSKLMKKPEGQLLTSTQATPLRILATKHHSRRI